MVATALTHGIITDTNGLTGAGPEDFHSAAFLSGFRDADLLQQIMNQSRSKKTMEIIHRGLENRVIAESFSIAGIGRLRAEDRDVIPQVADFLMTEENIHTAIVYGIVTGNEREEEIIGSLRTMKITLDPDEFIKDVFGKDALGNCYGGGKASAGGFKIPIGFLSGEREKHTARRSGKFSMIRSSKSCSPRSESKSTQLPRQNALPEALSTRSSEGHGQNRYL